jgi:hypothetical protein
MGKVDMARQYGRSPPEHVPIDWLTPGESLLLFKDSFPVHDLAAQTLRKIEEVSRGLGRFA